jgi:uncharacterized protein (TIGR02678 family)
MGLGETLATDRRDRLVEARRRLLASPLLHQAEEPDLFATMLALREELAGWFMETFGWRLVVDTTGGFARLRKIAACPDPTRPARVNDTDLNPRKYTLVFLACAALDEQPSQTTLSVLSEAVRELSATEGSIRDFDPHNRHGDRLAFAGALKWLEAHRVITVREGHLDDYRQDAAANALLDVDDRLLAQLLACPTSPALAEDSTDILAEVYPSGPEGETQQAGHRVRRRLADDPVVYYADLSEEERSWFGPRWRLVYQLASDLGLAIERRAEGVAAIDPESHGEPMTDIRFPRAGATVSHAALLLAEHLVARRRTWRGESRAAVQLSLDQGPNGEAGEEGCREADLEAPFLVARSDVVDHMTVCIGEYAARCGWAGWTLEDGGAERLADEAMEYLASFRLLVRMGDLVAPAPGIARFAVQTPDAT